MFPLLTLVDDYRLSPSLRRYIYRLVVTAAAALPTTNFCLFVFSPAAGNGRLVASSIRQLPEDLLSFDHW